MKIIRVPWIQCRADEVDALPFEMEWRGRVFSILAYSEKEAREWWSALPERDRSACFGLSAEPERGGTMDLF